jgi:hypothetical protein
MTGTRHVRITVRGRLTERLAATLDGLAAEAGDGVTDLAGDVADQAQLHALLTRLRDLGLEIEAMTVGNPDPRVGGPAGPAAAAQRREPPG